VKASGKREREKEASHVALSVAGMNTLRRVLGDAIG